MTEVLQLISRWTEAFPQRPLTRVLEAGANILVAGSAVFGGDILENTKALTKKNRGIPEQAVTVVRREGT